MTTASTMVTTQSETRIDVLVVGAGSAGFAAAASAAEVGARTLLVERTGHIGGTLAGQLLEHSAGFHDSAGNQVTAGIGQRLVDRLVAYGCSPGHVRDDVGYTASRTPVNHAELALTQAVMLDEAGAQLWLHAPVTAATADGGAVAAVTVETPGGTVTIHPRVVVDTSGDAVVAKLAGANFHEDSNDRTQPVSLTFKLAGIDFQPLLEYARNYPGDFRPGSVVGEADSQHVNLWGFTTWLREAYTSGTISLRRNEVHLAGWPRRGEAVVNVTRTPIDGLDGCDVGSAYLRLSRQVLEMAAWFRTYVPGCTESYVTATADRVGVRESRRVVGRATLGTDHLHTAATVPDAVACGGFPVDIHDRAHASLSHTDQLSSGYQIPYGCLMVDGLTNLLIAGRCISSTHEANGSARITATCFATGEAAGVAASLAATTGVPAVGIDTDQLRDKLRKRGAVLDVGADQ